MRFGRFVTMLVTLTLTLLAPATASAESFDPSDEFKLKDWVPIHLGGLNLSINRAVVYLFVGSAVTCLLGIGLMRWRIGLKPGRRQTTGRLLPAITLKPSSLPHASILFARAKVYDRPLSQKTGQDLPAFLKTPTSGLVSRAACFSSTTP